MKPEVIDNHIVINTGAVERYFKKLFIFSLLKPLKFN